MPNKEFDRYYTTIHDDGAILNIFKCHINSHVYFTKNMAEAVPVFLNRLPIQFNPKVLCGKTNRISPLASSMDVADMTRAANITTVMDFLGQAGFVRKHVKIFFHRFTGATTQETVQPKKLENETFWLVWFWFNGAYYGYDLDDLGNWDDLELEEEDESSEETNKSNPDNIYKKSLLALPLPVYNFVRHVLFECKRGNS